MEIHRVHDRFFRSFFSDPRHLKGMLLTALPEEVVAAIDLETVKIEPGTWIDRREKEHLSDLAASVEMATGTIARSGTTRIYILIEHKSWRDPAALLQLLRYMVQLWSAEIRTGTRLLTPVIPILVSHGRGAAIHETFSELFPDDIPEILRPYRVSFSTAVLNLSERTLEDLRGDPASRAALWLMRTIHRTAEEIFEELQAVLQGVGDHLNEEEYQALYSYILHTGELSAEQLSGKIEKSIHEQRIREGLLTTAEQLIKKGEEYGLQKGVEEGRREGRREMVRSMIEHGMTATEVARLSGLTLEEVQSLLQSGK